MSEESKSASCSSLSRSIARHYLHALPSLRRSQILRRAGGLARRVRCRSTRASTSGWSGATAPARPPSSGSISGEETPDRGDVVRARGLRLGLLEQHVHFEPGSTVHESALAAFGHLQQIEHEMHELEHRMAEARRGPRRGARTLQRAAAPVRARGRLRVRGARRGHPPGPRLRARDLGATRRRSSRAGSRTVWASRASCSPSRTCCCSTSRPTTSTSTSVEWLEEFLAAYNSAYVIISHDRYFLDRTAGRIVELENGRAVELHRQLLRLPRRARGAARGAAARLREPAAPDQQDRGVHPPQPRRAEDQAGQVAPQDAREARARRGRAPRPVLRATSACRQIERAGTQVLTVDGRRRSATPARRSARDITFTLKRGECLGVIGPNGSGKTTFVKTVLGKLPPLAGEIRWGTKVQVGYYAQQLDDLDDRNEIIMELRRVAPSTATAGELRSFLAQASSSRATTFTSTSATSRAARRAGSRSPSSSTRASTCSSSTSRRTTSTSLRARRSKRRSTPTRARSSPSATTATSSTASPRRFSRSTARAAPSITTAITPSTTTGARRESAAAARREQQPPPLAAAVVEAQGEVPAG